MAVQTKNYTAAGDKTVINGTLVIGEDATITDTAGKITGEGLPDVTASDNGKIMQVSGGQWHAAADRLPAVAAANNGKILKVIDGAWALGDDANTTYDAATDDTLGLVYQAANVAEAVGDAPTAAEFKALLDALIAAGIMAAAGD